MPEPRMAYITNRRLFENAFEIAAKNKFQQYCEDLAETKFKNKRLPMVKRRWKTKTSERNSKSGTRKVYKTPKYGMVS